VRRRLSNVTAWARRSRGKIGSPNPQWAEPMPDNSAPLTAAELRAYLDSQDDFAFERRVFTHAKGFGLAVEHAGLYEDPATSKIRQFDLRASIEHGDHRLSVAIECKSLSPSFPLLISCVPRSPSESYHQVIYGLTGPTFSADGNAELRDMRTSLYAAGEYVGKDMSQVGRDRRGGFTGNDEKVFDKYQQAMASATDLIAAAVEYHRPRRAVEKVTAILPVLVVPDRTLWQARYSSRGQLEGEPEPADHLTFYLGRKYPVPNTGLEFRISHLHVVSETRMATLLGEIGHAGGIWQLVFHGP
jgi:hypothetical protein